MKENERTEGNDKKIAMVRIDAYVPTKCRYIALSVYISFEDVLKGGALLPLTLFLVLVLWLIVVVVEVHLVV